MFEARIKQGAVLKKVLDSVKDLVTDANFEADPSKVSNSKPWIRATSRWSRSSFTPMASSTTDAIAR